LKTCWPIQEYVILHIWICKHKVWSPWLTWSWVNNHDTCRFKITLNYFWHIIGNEGEKLVIYPIRLLQDFCFLQIHTQEDIVYGVNNTLSTSQGFCVSPVIDTTSFKKSSMPWWDFVVNSFTANFVPSNKIPYKIHKKLICIVYWKFETNQTKLKT
jgi:hypothetical protein